MAGVATERAVATLNERMAPVINCAERRHAASLYNLDKVSLDATDFPGLLNDSSGALPFVPEGEELPRWPWSWNERAPPVAPDDGGGGGGAAAAAADDDDDDDSHLDAWAPCHAAGGVVALQGVLPPRASSANPAL